MAGVDDWYLNRAHRHELAPGHSFDDDVPDPAGFGEVPGREWIVPRRRRPRSSRRSGLASSPNSNHKQSRTKNTAQRAPKPTAGARHRQSAGTSRGQHIAAWQQFALRWLRANPGASNRELKAAVEEAGFLPLVKAEIAALRAQVSSSKKASRPRSAPRARRTAQSPPATSYIPLRYCDSCGLAVTHDGRCRC